MQKIVAFFKYYLLKSSNIFEVIGLTTGEIDLSPFLKFAAEHVAVGIHAVDLKGKTILYIVRNLEHPSTLAASSTSTGTDAIWGIKIHAT